MKIIDFDGHFREYIATWCRNIQDDAKALDEMEDEMPTLYLQWQQTPADWLDGIKPADYFAQYDDVDALIAWMLKYQQEKQTIPDLLLDRIVDLGDTSQEALVHLVTNATQDEEIRMIAMDLLNEIQSVQPLAAYIKLIENETNKNLADKAAEMLIEMGDMVLQPVLNALEGRILNTARERYIYVLSAFKSQPKVFAWLLKMFETAEENKGLYACYLGQYGDATAIPVLQSAMQDSELSYVDYQDIKQAIEALGGEVHAERDFTNDPQYQQFCLENDKQYLVEQEGEETE